MARMRISRDFVDVAKPTLVGLPHGAADPPGASERSSAAQTPPSDPPAQHASRGSAHWWRLSQRISPERRPMAVALLSSVLIHTLLLSLTFGDQGLGLPGLGLPWRERRVEVPDLRVVLLPARVTPAAPPAPAAP